MHEIEQRSVIGKGKHMLESGHPAAQFIEVRHLCCIFPRNERCSFSCLLMILPQLHVRRV